MGRRRRCAVSGAALAGVDGVIRPFANVGLFGGFADADGHMRDSLPDWLRHDGTAADAWAPTTTNVTTARLVSVLRRHGAPAVVDYLSLDVEGAEYEVLADPELHAAFAFRAISVEHNAHRHGVKTRDALRNMLAGFGYEVVEAGRTDAGDAIDDFYVPRAPPGTPGPNVVAVLRPRATNGASNQLAALHALVAVANAVGGLDLAELSIGLPDGGRAPLSAISESAELEACVGGTIVAEAAAATGGGRARVLCFADHVFEALGESPEGLGRCGELAAKFGCAAGASCVHSTALLLELDLAAYAQQGWTADVVDLGNEEDGDALLEAARAAKAGADALVLLDSLSVPDLARAAFASISPLCASTSFGGLFALPRESRAAAVVAAKAMCGGDFVGVHWRRDDYCVVDEGCVSVEVVARAAAKAAAGGCVFVATDERDAEVLERFEKAVRLACDACTVAFETSFFSHMLAAGTPASAQLAAATAAKATLALARTFVATTHPHWGLSSFSWHVGVARFAAGRAPPIFYDEATAVDVRDRFSPAEPYRPGGRAAAPDTRRGPGPDGGAPLRGSPPLALPDGTASVVLNIGSSLDPALPAPGSIGVVTVAFEPLPDVAAAIPVRPNLVVVAAAVAAYDGLGGMRRYNEGGVSSSLHTAARRGEWNVNTTRGDGARVVVPVLALGKILESIREDVFFLKTDMQGADFDAVSSVDRKLLRRVSFLATETWAENARTYAGVANDLCRDWVPAMERAGFVLVHVAPVFAVPYVSDHAAFAEAFVVHDRCGRDDAVPTQFEYCEADAYWVRDDIMREMRRGDFATFDALSTKLNPKDWPVSDFAGLPRPTCAGPGPRHDGWETWYEEVDAAAAGLRNLTPHEYNQWRGPWLENAWIARWRDQPKEAFGGRVPVFAQWTDAVFLRGTDDAMDAAMAASVEALKAVMRPDVAYVTLSQHDEGLRVLDAGLAASKNLLVLSAGGFGDVALPLVADGLTRPFDDGGEFTAAPFPRKYTFLLCGRATHAVRRRIADIIAGDPTLDAATVTYFGQDWRSRLNEATYVVAPRGYGRSSFFLYECLAAGALPIYVYDDEPWLPYALPVDVIHIDDLADALRGLLAAPRAPDELKLQRRAALAAAPRLTFDGLWEDVAAFFRHRGPLRCRPRPGAPRTSPRLLPHADAPFREVVVNLVPPPGAAPGPEAVRWFANETALDAARRFAAVHGVATAPECGVACAVGRLEAVMLRDADRRPSVTANNCETYTECMSAARARAL